MTTGIQVDMQKSSNMFTVKITDKNVLYNYYMPFLRGGGLFIPATTKKLIGEEVFLLIKLMDDVEPTPLVGQVAWKTPSASDGNRHQGFGVQFTRDENNLRERIELILGVQLHSGQPTMTL